MDFLRAIGGVAGLATALQSSVESGLSADASSTYTGLDGVAEHRRVFGANTLPAVPPKNVRHAAKHGRTHALKLGRPCTFGRRRPISTHAVHVPYGGR